MCQKPLLLYHFCIDRKGKRTEKQRISPLFFLDVSEDVQTNYNRSSIYFFASLKKLTIITTMITPMGKAEMMLTL